MSTQIMFFIILALSLPAIVLTLLKIGHAYTEATKKLHQAEREKEEIAKHAQEKATATLDEARNKALRIIEEANRQTVTILTKARYDEEEQEAAFAKRKQALLEAQQQALEKAAASLQAEYTVMLQKLEKNSINLLSTASQSLTGEAAHEIDDFKHILQDETVASQKIVEQKIEEAFKQAEQDVATYKDQQLRKIDHDIYEIMKATITLAMGKSFAMDDHQALILDALAQAKNEGVFTNAK